MAEAERSIFNKRATEKLRSPDDLDKYVQVTNPAVWVVLLACVALLVGLLAWGIFGTVDTTISTSGALITTEKDGEDAKMFICLLEPETVSDVTTGDVASVNGVQMEVADVQKIPISPDEAKKLLKSDFLINALIKGDWSYMVTLKGDTSGLTEGIPTQVKITTSRDAPLALMFKNNG